jgi:hypothetical protein
VASPAKNGNMSIYFVALINGTNLRFLQEEVVHWRDPISIFSETCFTGVQGRAIAAIPRE